MVASTFLSQALQRKTEMICGGIFGLTLAANDRVAYIARVVLGSPSHITTISIAFSNQPFGIIDPALETSLPKSEPRIFSPFSQAIYLRAELELLPFEMPFLDGRNRP